MSGGAGLGYSPVEVRGKNAQGNARTAVPFAAHPLASESKGGTHMLTHAVRKNLVQCIGCVLAALIACALFRLLAASWHLLRGAEVPLRESGMEYAQVLCCCTHSLLLFGSRMVMLWCWLSW